MERTRLAKYMVSEEGMQRVLRHQIDRPAEQFGELVFEPVDRKPETPIWSNDVQEVDVAPFSRVPPSDRPEHVELDDPVPFTDLAQACRVDACQVQGG